VIQKVYNKLESEDERAVVRDMIENNLGYVGDKGTKQRCLALIKDVPQEFT
jgi:hypothetical protein